MAGIDDQGASETKAQDMKLGGSTPGGSWGGPPVSTHHVPAAPQLRPYGDTFNTAGADPVELAKLKRLQQARQITVGVAVVLLVVSFMLPSTVLAYMRGATWVVAGILSLMEASQAEKAGYSAQRARAFVYFAVALIPFLRGR